MSVEEILRRISGRYNVVTNDDGSVSIYGWGRVTLNLDNVKIEADVIHLRKEGEYVVVKLETGNNADSSTVVELFVEGTKVVRLEADSSVMRYGFRLSAV